MSTQRVDILTPVGRLVGGSCWEAQTTDAEGKPLVVKTGKNVGQPRENYYLAIAFEKTNAEFNDTWKIINDVAKASFPAFFGADGKCTLPTFAFKFTDGDSKIPNLRGNKPCDSEGYPGHWILHFSNGFPPECFTKGGAARITDPGLLKTGYYVRIYGDVKSNESENKPGVYLNHSKVELIGFADEIITGISGEQAFGGKDVGQLPAGMSTTPVASTTTIATESSPGQATAASTPGTSASSPGTEAPPEVDKQSRMTTAARSTYAEYKKNNWTDEQLIAKQYMTAGAPTEKASDFVGP